MTEYRRAVLKKVWHLLPLSVRNRVRATLAAHDIGRMHAQPAGDLGHLGIIANAPSEMSLDERLFLYSLIRGRNPRRVLEIGTSQGGSAAIIAAALEDNDGDGRIIGIDPMPRIELDPAVFHGRFDLVTGKSPEAVTQAAERAGAPFDIVLIDGIHIYQQAADDLAASLPFATPDAYFLFHDSFHFGVSEAIREAVERHPDLHDCGYVCSRPRRVGDLLTHAGFRLLRRGGAIVDPTPLVAPLWREVNAAPPHDPALRNHDIWYCDAIEPCNYCVAQRATST